MGTDELIKHVFDKHKINYGDVKLDKPPYSVNYVDDSYDSIKDAIIEIVAVKIAESVVLVNTQNP